MRGKQRDRDYVTTRLPGDRGSVSLSSFLSISKFLSVFLFLSVSVALYFPSSSPPSPCSFIPSSVSDIRTFCSQMNVRIGLYNNLENNVDDPCI